MARSFVSNLGGDLGGLIVPGALAVAGYWAYSTGKLDGLFNKKPLAALPVAPKKWPCPTVPAAVRPKLAVLVKANANFVAQMRAWQAARIQHGEDPNNWAGFRSHMASLGAPAVGNYPPVEWCG